MAQQATNQTVTVPADLLQSLLNSVNSLRDEVSLLRNETKDSMAAVLASISPPTPRGAFSLFPELVPEIRHMIWDAALHIPRIVGAKIVPLKNRDYPEALTPIAPNSSILFVNKESRTRAKKVLACVTAKEISSRGRIPLLYINPAVDTVWVVNCTWENARNGSVTVLLGKSMILKVAIPFETWVDMLDNMYNYEAEDTLRFLIKLREKGIESVAVALGGEDAAERLDPIFTEPKEIPDFYLGHEMFQETEGMQLDRNEEAKKCITSWCNGVWRNGSRLESSS
ncbi:hypothetical protein F5882DRAFT_385559 [Hyaloscypha sp. PMI_1271]|nr:hypothetical protein F5882DRAFT_385559 [Hyaloscypha sp. PMI_1271]